MYLSFSQIKLCVSICVIYNDKERWIIFIINVYDERRIEENWSMGNFFRRKINALALRGKMLSGASNSGFYFSLKRKKQIYWFLELLEKKKLLSLPFLLKWYLFMYSSKKIFFCVHLLHHDDYDIDYNKKLLGIMRKIISLIILCRS